MPNTPDARYNTQKPWVADPKAAYPPQSYIGPFQSNRERLLSQALHVGTLTAEEIQEYVRPNIPQIQLFPDRFGYPTTEIGIEDVVQLTGRTMQRTESDFSQTPATTQSTSRNTLGNA